MKTLVLRNQMFSITTTKPRVNASTYVLFDVTLVDSSLRRDEEIARPLAKGPNLFNFSRYEERS